MCAVSSDLHGWMGGTCGKKLTLSGLGEGCQTRTEHLLGCKANNCKHLVNFGGSPATRYTSESHLRNAMSNNSPVVEIEGKHLKLSNLDKVLYPAAGFTKGQVIDYYARIAPVLLPHLKNKPLTMKRYPGGVNEEFFFEKNAPQHRPDWVKTVAIWSYGNKRNVNYILCNDLPTLIWIANLASLELHPSLSLATDIHCPTM